MSLGDRTAKFVQDWDAASGGTMYRNAVQVFTEAEARIQSLEAELNHYKHMYENAEAAARHLKIARDELAALNVSGVNLGEIQAERRFSERMKARVTALAKVLKQAQETILRLTTKPCAYECTHRTCRVQREISKALGVS